MSQDRLGSRCRRANSRHATAEPIDIEAALAEIRAVPAATPAVLAEAAGLTLGFHHTAVDWSTRVIEAGLLIGAGADLSQLRPWIREGTERQAMPHHAAP
jgi:hypothetical protein